MKEITYELIKEANDSCLTTKIKDKDYVEVNQRIKAFRMVYPTGFIKTTMLSNENGVCVFCAECGYTEFLKDGDDHYPVNSILGIGHAYEKMGSTFINKTSYIENCETSAVGRALGMAGFGINESVASYEEVANAKENQQPKKATPKQVEFLSNHYSGENLTKLLEKNSIEKLEDISMEKASEIISKIKKVRSENE